MSGKRNAAAENLPGSIGFVRSGDSRKLFIRESVIFALCGLFFYIFARIGIDPHHDGVMLIPAIKVAQGAVVFRDVFCQYGLLVPLLQGGAVALFGEELLVIRILTVLFYAGSAVLLDLLWRRFLPGKLSWLTTVMFLLFAPCTMVTFHSWSSVYSLFFMLLTGLFVIRYLEAAEPDRKMLFFVGAAAGLTWACRTPCGMVTVFALLLVFAGLNFFTGKTRKTILAENLFIASGIAAVLIPALLYLLLTGAWQDFIKQSFGYVSDFVYDRGGEGSWKYFCESLFPFYQETFWFLHTFFALLPLASMVLLYFSCRNGLLDGKEKMKKILPLAALLIFGLGSWHQYYPVPCVRHLYWGGVPMFGAFLLAIYRLWQMKNIKTKITAILMIVAALAAVGPRIYGVFNRIELNSREVSSIPGIRGLRLNNMEKGIVALARTVEQMPPEIRERGVLNWSEDSLLTLVTRQCDIRDVQFYRFKTAQYPDYDGRMLRYVMEKRPAVLLDHQVFIPGYRAVYVIEYLGKPYWMLQPDR